MIVLGGLEAGVHGLEFSPDGSAVLACGWGFTAVWPLPDGGSPAPHRGLTGATFAPEGGVIVAVESTAAPQRIGRVGPHPGTAFTGVPIDGIALGDGRFGSGQLRRSPAGDRLVAADLSMMLRGWSWPGLEALPEWPRPPDAAAIDYAFSPDGASLALLHTEGVCRLETATGNVAWRRKLSLPGESGAVAWSPDGRFVAAGAGRRALVVNAANGRTVRELVQERKHVLDVEFTPDGRFLATVSHEKTVKFFDTESWELRHELACKVGALRALAFSGDGLLAAAGGVGKKVVVWDLDL